jgi:hypothetical protein
MVWAKPNHITTLIEHDVSENTRLLVTDPRHPLYGQLFTIIGTINRKDHGRCFIVRMLNGLERNIPMSATDRAEDDNPLFPLPLCLASVTNLLTVYARFFQLWKERTYETQSQTCSSGVDSAALPTRTAIDEEI